MSCRFFVASGQALPGVRDRPLAQGLALPIVAALSGSEGLGQAGNGDPVAPSGIPLVLALALEIRTAVRGARGSLAPQPPGYGIGGQETKR
jgi:hypothetical protein